jgi:hypothetical protein
MNHWRGLRKLAPYLEEHGLVFVDKHPNVIFCSNLPEKVLGKKKPIIIMERRAAASLKKATRRYLKNPIVKAVFKNRTLKDKSLDNQPAIYESYFLTLLNKYANITKPKQLEPLNSEELNKIHPVVWDLAWSPFSDKLLTCKQYEIDYAQDRPIDVFFAGTIYNDLTASANAKKGLWEFLAWHRSHAIDAIKKIKNINAYVLEGKALPFDEYLKTIQSTKIVVSPWGYGEWCYRDYETIHCGAILIKPDSSFVESIPDIYQNNITYIACKPDFSDLQDLVRHILDHYDEYTAMREYAKKVVKDAWQPETLARDFVTHVRAALQWD